MAVTVSVIADPIKTRTILTPRGYRRVTFPQSTGFATSSFATPTGGVSYVFSYDGGLGPNTRAFLHPLSTHNDYEQQPPHVYCDGSICFDYVAQAALRDGRPIVEVFWSSGFVKTPAWLRESSGSVTAPLSAELLCSQPYPSEPYATLGDLLGKLGLRVDWSAVQK